MASSRAGSASGLRTRFRVSVTRAAMASAGASLSRAPPLLSRRPQEAGLPTCSPVARETPAVKQNQPVQWWEQWRGGVQGGQGGRAYSVSAPAP